MSQFTTIRDDKLKETKVIIGINPEEMFTDEFMSWLEKLLLCVIAKNMASEWKPEDVFHEYTKYVVDAVVKAALAMSKKVGIELTCDDNAEESFRRICGIIDGEETK